MIIGLSGHPGCGRGTAGRILVEERGYQLVTFARVASLPEPPDRSDRFVITGLRSADEARWIRGHGGVVVRIYRGEERPISGSPELPGADIYIPNDGNIAMLRNIVLYYEVACRATLKR